MWDKVRQTSGLCKSWDKSDDWRCRIKELKQGHWGNQRTAQDIASLCILWLHGTQGSKCQRGNSVFTLILFVTLVEVTKPLSPSLGNRGYNHVFFFLLMSTRIPTRRSPHGFQQLKRRYNSSTKVPLQLVFGQVPWVSCFYFPDIWNWFPSFGRPFYFPCASYQDIKTAMI